MFGLSNKLEPQSHFKQLHTPSPNSHKLEAIYTQVFETRFIKDVLLVIHAHRCRSDYASLDALSSPLLRGPNGGDTPGLVHLHCCRLVVYDWAKGTVGEACTPVVFGNTCSLLKLSESWPSQAQISKGKVTDQAWMGSCKNNLTCL